MKAQFIVTVEGDWLDGGKRVTHSDVEKELRKAAKDGFEFLADRVTVKRLKAAQTAPVEPQAQEQLSEAEFLSKRLARVAKLVGVPMPDMTHEQIAGVAGTLLGQIASKLDAAPVSAVNVPEGFKLVDERELLKVKHALESCDAGDYSTGSVIHPSYDEKAVEDALNSITSMVAAAPAAPVDQKDAPIAANSDAGWLPIESAPEVKGDFFFCRLAWGPDEDKSTGDGFRWNDRWFAASTFYALGKERRYEIREHEVTPSHWMPLPATPAAIAATQQKKEGE